MMTESDLIHQFLDGRVDRRTLIRGLVAAGLSLSGATAFVGVLSPEVAEADTLSEKPVAGHRSPVLTSVSPTAGPTKGGTRVTIKGRNLSKAKKVHFGTKTARIHSNSSTDLTVTSPAGSGTVDVTVTGPAGTSAKSSKFEFHYDSRPAVSNVAPNSGPSSGGTKVTITGTGLSAVTAVSFGSKKAKVDSKSRTSLVATSPAGSGTVDVIVTSPGGTSVKSAVDHFSYEFPHPTPTPPPPTPTPTPTPPPTPTPTPPTPPPTPTPTPPTPPPTPTPTPPTPPPTPMAPRFAARRPGGPVVAGDRLSVGRRALSPLRRPAHRDSGNPR
jgi:hypothetical protein